MSFQNDILKIKSKRTLPYCMYGYSSVDGFLVSKENMVLCRWRVTTKMWLYQKGDKGWIATAKGLVCHLSSGLVSLHTELMNASHSLIYSQIQATIIISTNGKAPLHSHNYKHTTLHNSSIRSDERLMPEMSAF